MPQRYNILILGSKEYPLGSNKGDDPITSGGMETIIHNLAPELARQSNVMIVTRKFSGAKWHERGLVEVYRVPWIKGKYTRTPSFTFFASILSFFLLLRGKVDIIYAHGVIASFPAFFLSRLFKKPIICRPHGSGASQWFFPINQMMHFARRFVFSRCDMLIFNSKGEKANMSKSLGIEFNRYKIIMTSVPIEKIPDQKLKRELGLLDEIIISYIGRLHQVKGIRYLIDALSRVKGDFKALVVGEGPQRNELEKQVEERGLEDKVMFLGFRKDIQRVLGSTDIFVLPSLSEGVPRSLLEAMAAGRACIVTNIGLPVEDMKTAVVVPPKDVGALTEAIELLAQNAELREDLGRNARRFIEENCNIKKDVEEHLVVFEEVAKRVHGV